MIKISVVIITLNEEKNLSRCLESVKHIADEIVVVDSFSTDKTIEIATTYNASIYQEKFLGYGAQKNSATDKASNNWILALDADEALSKELEQSILEVKSNPEYNVYELSRLNNYCGKWIRHGGWYPDKKIRLYDRTKGSWRGEKIHESWMPDDKNEGIGKLKGDLLHYSYYTISDHIRQIEKFTEMSALESVSQGKSCSILKIWIVPIWMFLQNYFLRLGFLDGEKGYLVCKFSAHAAFIKYSKIRQYALFKAQGKLVQ
ncbi:MAG: glycosyltransferase family 2 protein [Bacteriovorax sp.]